MYMANGNRITLHKSRCLCLMKWPSETFVFHFMLGKFFSCTWISVFQKYDTFWSISLDHFIQYNRLNPEVCHIDSTTTTVCRNQIEAWLNYWWENKTCKELIRKLASYWYDRFLLLYLFYRYDCQHLVNQLFSINSK